MPWSISESPDSLTKNNIKLVLSTFSLLNIIPINYSRLFQRTHVGPVILGLCPPSQVESLIWTDQRCVSYLEMKDKSWTISISKMGTVTLCSIHSRVRVHDFDWYRYFRKASASLLSPWIKKRQGTIFQNWMWNALIWKIIEYHPLKFQIWIELLALKNNYITIIMYINPSY